MRLDVDLSSLWGVVHKMGAKEIEFDISANITHIDPIDKALNEGVEVRLEDIEFDTGLAAYHGRQVLLYIKDHGGRVENALQDGSRGNKYHVADCSMLDKMRKRGRFDRYVVKNDLTGSFVVSGTNWKTNTPMEGEAKLKVCKLCLEHLNYQGYRNGNRGKIFSSFDLSDFFDKYSSFFKTSPSGVADTRYSDYTEDWTLVSRKVKQQHHYVCQECGVDLGSNRPLLHVHHKNGVKQDNSAANLIPLCADCHRKQPYHTHLFVSHDDAVTINQLRNSQGKNVLKSWKDVYAACDPALYGVVDLLEKNRVPLPRVGWDLQNEQGGVVAHLELGWPDQRLAIVIAKGTSLVAKEHGWSALSMRNGLIYTEHLLSKLRF